MNTNRLIKEFLYSKENDKKDSFYKEHFHDDYQLIFTVKGCVEFLFGNKTFVADANSIVFISNLENHTVSVMTEEWERYYLTMSVRMVEETIADSQLLSVFKNRPVSFCNVFQIQPIAEEITALFRLMHDEVNRTPNEYSERYVRHILNLIFLSIYRNNHHQFPILRESVKSQVYDIQKHLDHHYNETLSLQDLCKDFYISFSYLSRCFKELTGYSPKQYIMIRRLSHARSLIITTDLSISDVAYKSGFGDVNNFIRHFKMQYGLTPTHLRKNHN